MNDEAPLGLLGETHSVGKRTSFRFHAFKSSPIRIWRLQQRRLSSPSLSRCRRIWRVQVRTHTGLTYAPHSSSSSILISTSIPICKLSPAFHGSYTTCISWVLTLRGVSGVSALAAPMAMISEHYMRCIGSNIETWHPPLLAYHPLLHAGRPTGTGYTAPLQDQGEARSRNQSTAEQ